MAANMLAAQQRTFVEVQGNHVCLSAFCLCSLPLLQPPSMCALQAPLGLANVYWLRILRSTDDSPIPLQLT